MTTVSGAVNSDYEKELKGSIYVVYKSETDRTVDQVYFIADDDESADDVVVAAEVFRATVDHQVSTEFERTLVIAGQKRVVDDEQRAMLMGDIGERLDV